MSFEVGDKVIDLKYGEGVVEEIVTHAEFPVKVTFDDDRWDDYLLDGKAAKNSPYPSLYHAEGFTPPSCKEPERKPKCNFKPFDKVLVRDNKKQIWQPDIFAYLEPDAATPFVCIGNMWAFCIPYEGNEDKCGKVTE